MPSGTPLAHYIARFYQPGQGNDYMWDELARGRLDRSSRDHPSRRLAT